MPTTRSTILASRPAAMVLALSLVAGLSAPFILLPPVSAALIVPDGTTELSAAPVEQSKSVPPNIVVTFDDSGSMSWDYMGDNRPFDNGPWSSGPWYCAAVIDPSATAGIGDHVMNGVYYNPNVSYLPPVNADGTSFKNADVTLTAVQNDGVTANRPRLPQGAGSTTNFTGAVGPGTGWYWNGSGVYTNFNNWVWGVFPTGSGYYSTRTQFNKPNNVSQIRNGAYPTVDQRWVCPYDSTSPIAAGGPYYYKYTGPAIAVDQYGNPTPASLSDLYKIGNWTAVAVGTSGIATDTDQNWANWWAFYHTRNLMARTSLSRVFGSSSLAAKTDDGGYGSDIRVAWQNINTSNFLLPSNAIISSLIDTSACASAANANPQTVQRDATPQVADACYRSAFFNWIFQVPASGSTPLRGALNRAGTFYTQGTGNTGASGNLTDPYWQPPQTGAFNATTNPGNELYCRQNYSLLVTDGLWNQDGTLPAVQPLPGTLPDGVAFPATAGSTGGTVTSIYAPQHDVSGNVSLSDVAMVYWANNLRTDLYKPAQGQIVTPYLPDKYVGLFAGVGNVAGGYGDAQNIPAEMYFNPRNDPATWPHMSDYMVGLGVSGTLNFSENTDCKDTTPSALDACDLRKGIVNSNGAIGWPTPNGNGQGIAANIDDTWHAALAARGQFFSAGNPQQLVDQLGSILSSIAARAGAPTPGAVNASVITTGALAFSVGHRKDWSGDFVAKYLNADGTPGALAWDAGAELNAVAPADRVIYTDSYKGGTFNTFLFTAANSGLLDARENSAPDPTQTPPVAGQGLQSPALAGVNDTVANRIDYLRGVHTYESGGTYRQRDNILGAILHSQPIYVSFATASYTNRWPNNADGSAAPEAVSGVQSYDAFRTQTSTRPGTVYVGANDGMLHAFNAPIPVCTVHDPATGACTTYNAGTDPGKEIWAFVPRAVYANLGNLTSATDFQFRPTVDASPVTRDVFFGQKFSGDDKWHTLLASGVGIGGRGVFALDVTDPTTFSASDVLWEFDSDIPIPSGCKSIQGNAADSIGCRATDLGFTVSQPNIARLATGEWVVLVPNGYFPDCSKTIPTADKTTCSVIAAQAPKDSTGKPYSALFVLDAESGKVIAELKTPQISGVTSFGLATPVVGDYQSDQIDDVAFAGDLQGNLWRFDLSGATADAWTVTLVYKGLTDVNGNQGLQPITAMPRLFPDPVTNRFMVVFGTGKYLGAGDNGNNTVQVIAGVRDVMGTTYSQTDPALPHLTQQFMHETIAPATLPDGTTPNPNAGATLRCVTGKATDTCDATTAAEVNASANSGGWFINLYTTTSGGVQNDQGERVVVNPGAIFASNTVVFQTLLTGTLGSDPCNPSVQGAILALNAVTGAPAGVSSLGGWPIVGGRISNARTSGSLPLVSALGGGQAYLPGMSLAPPGKNPISIDAPIWRRRSWSEINQNH